MARSFEDWKAALVRTLGHVHPEGTRVALAGEIAVGKRELQRTAPRGTWKRRVTAKARGFRTLFNSFTHEVKAGGQGVSATISTNHPGVKLTDEGGTVTPKRKSWLWVPFKNWTPSKAGFFAIQISGNRLAVVSRKNPGRGIYGIFAKSITVRGTHWRERAERVWLERADERVADATVRFDRV